MPSFRQVLAAHAPLLLLDAASSRIQIGVFEAPDRARWSASDEEAGVGIFRGIESLNIDLAEIRAFAFAEGPGSILGIRIASMALRTWREISPRPIFAYHALALMAAALARPDLTLIADARRGYWHCCRLGRPPWREPAAGLSGEMGTPEEFRHWSALPAAVEKIPYRLDQLLPRAAGADLFRPTEAPDAHLSEEPSYATWTNHIHRRA